MLPSSRWLTYGDSTPLCESLMDVFKRHYHISGAVTPFVKSSADGAFVEVTAGTVLALKSEIFFLPSVVVRTVTIRDYPHEQARQRIADKARHAHISGSAKRIAFDAPGDTALHVVVMAYHAATLDHLLAELLGDCPGASIANSASVQLWKELHCCNFEVHSGGPRRRDSKESDQSGVSYALSVEVPAFYGKLELLHPAGSVHHLGRLGAGFKFMPVPVLLLPVQ